MEDRAPRHVREAVAAAEAARVQAGVALDEALPDLLEAVEGPLGLPVVLAPLGDGVSGAYVHRGALRFAVVSSDEAPVRRRFTLAHELGHDRLHGAEALDSAATLADWGDPVEAGANHFAATFLAPEAAVRRLVDGLDDDAPTLELVVRVAAAFGISAQAACIRLEVLGLLGTLRTRIDRLHRESRDGTHRACARLLGLDELDDACARIAPGALRVPEAARGTALAALARR